MQRCCDLYLLDEREGLVKSVKENCLVPSLFGAPFSFICFSLFAYLLLFRV
jgi:hypothetical protein